MQDFAKQLFCEQFTVTFQQVAQDAFYSASGRKVIMHKRKSVLVNSSALFSLKLCIFFRLFSSFFRLFSSFFYLFCLFPPFSVFFYVFFCPFISFSIPFPPFNSSLPFVILLYPYPHSFYSFLPFSLLYSALFRNHLFLIFYSYKAFFRLYRFIFYSCLILALIIFYLSLLPLFLSPLSLCVPFYLSLNSLLYLLLFLFMCSLCSDLIF